MDLGYLDFGRNFKLYQPRAYFVTRAKRRMNTRRVYSNKTDRSAGLICVQSIRLNGFYVSNKYPEHLRRIRFKDPETGKTLVFLANTTTLDALTIAALYKKPVSRIVLQVDQAASAYQAFSGYEHERGEDTNIVRGAHLRADRHH
jgi:hypothetical protein